MASDALRVTSHLCTGACLEIESTDTWCVDASRIASRLRRRVGDDSVAVRRRWNETMFEVIPPWFFCKME